MFVVSPSIRLLALAAAVASLSACTSVGYRCPLDPTDDPDSPTACAGMHDALQGAKHTSNSGSRTSVLLDAEGRQIPSAMRTNKPRSPLAGSVVDEGAPEPYRTKAGDPIFEPPKVFQTWVRSFVDAEGNLHEGHHTWFSTPGRWRYGDLRAAGEVGGDLMRPALPSDRTHGRVQAPTAPTPQPTAGPTTAPKQVTDKAALNNLSSAASAMNNRQVPSQVAPGMTAPAVNLSE